MNAAPQAEQRALSPIEQKGKRLAQFLASDNNRKRIAGALPKHMTADRCIRMALTAATKTPKLLDCSPESVCLALLQASQLGVEINGRDAHLVPFKGDCQLIIDYKGYVQLAYRSGVVKSIKAKAVHEKDEFSYSEGTDEHLTYKAFDGEGDPGPLTHAWAMCKLMNGGECWVVMNRRQIMARRAISRNPDNWDKYPEAYWAKTAVREMAKWMPQTAELQSFHKLIEASEANESIDVSSVEVSPVEAPTSRADEIAGRIGANGNGRRPAGVGYGGGDAPDVAPLPDVNDPPFNPPTEAEQAEARRILATQALTESSIDRGPATQEVVSDADAAVLDDWQVQLDGAATITECSRLENENLSKAPPHLQERVMKMILDRKTLIRGQRGGRQA